MEKGLIIIPAYNEEKNIRNVLLSLQSIKDHADILVINDGSNDETAQIATEFPVALVSHPTNLGYASALQTGYKYACQYHYPYVVQIDGDGQHDTANLADFIRYFQSATSDIMIGSRFLSKSDMKISFSKNVAINIFRLVIRIFTSSKITDPTSGFKAFRWHVFRNFVKVNQFPAEYPDSNFIIELLLKNYQVEEFPVNMRERNYGTSMHTGLKPILYMGQVMMSTFLIYLRHKFTKGESNA